MRTKRTWYVRWWAIVLWVFIGLTVIGAISDSGSETTTGSVQAVTFTDATHGWAVGASGTILATTDGGATWRKQSSGG